MKVWLGEALYLLAVVITIALTHASGGGAESALAYAWFLLPIILWTVIYVLTKRSLTARGLKGVHYVPVIIGSALTFGQLWYIQYAFAIDLGGITTSSSTAVLTLYFAPAFGLFLGGVAYLGLKFILYIKVKRNEI